MNSYCVKCRAKTADTGNPIMKVTKNNRMMKQVKCAKCGTTKSQFVKSGDNLKGGGLTKADIKKARVPIIKLPSRTHRDRGGIFAKNIYEKVNKYLDPSSKLTASQRSELKQRMLAAKLDTAEEARRETVNMLKYIKNIYGKRFFKPSSLKKIADELVEEMYQ